MTQKNNKKHITLFFIQIFLVATLLSSCTMLRSSGESEENQEIALEYGSEETTVETLQNTDAATETGETTIEENIEQESKTEEETENDDSSTEDTDDASLSETKIVIDTSPFLCPYEYYSNEMYEEDTESNYRRTREISESFAEITADAEALYEEEGDNEIESFLNEVEELRKEYDEQLDSLILEIYYTDSTDAYESLDQQLDDIEDGMFEDLREEFEDLGKNDDSNDNYCDATCLTEMLTSFQEAIDALHEDVEDFNVIIENQEVNEEFTQDDFDDVMDEFNEVKEEMEETGNEFSEEINSLLSEIEDGNDYEDIAEDIDDLEENVDELADKITEDLDELQDRLGTGGDSLYETLRTTQSTVDTLLRDVEMLSEYLDETNDDKNEEVTALVEEIKGKQKEYNDQVDALVLEVYYTEEDASDNVLALNEDVAVYAKETYEKINALGFSLEQGVGCEQELTTLYERRDALALQLEILVDSARDTYHIIETYHQNHKDDDDTNVESIEEDLTAMNLLYETVEEETEDFNDEIDSLFEDITAVSSNEEYQDVVDDFDALTEDIEEYAEDIDETIEEYYVQYKIMGFEKDTASLLYDVTRLYDELDDSSINGEPPDPEIEAEIDELYEEAEDVREEYIIAGELSDEIKNKLTDVYREIREINKEIEALP